MTLAELIVNLKARWPQRAEAIQGWLPSYQRAFGGLTDEQIEIAWNKTIAHWTNPTHFPLPADFLPQIPKRSRAPVGAEGEGRRAMRLHRDARDVARRVMTSLEPRLREIEQRFPERSGEKWPRACFRFHVESLLRAAAWPLVQGDVPVVFLEAAIVDAALATAQDRTVAQTLSSAGPRARYWWQKRR